MGSFSEGAVFEGVVAQKGRAEELFAELARLSRDEPGLTRDSYGAGENAAHRLVAEHANGLALEIERDYAANTYMTLPGIDRSAPKVLIGSHLDSVRHGGNFDGAAGVVAGLVAVATIAKLGLRPRCDISVMGVRAEESVWFQVSYVGSRAALGVLPDGALESRRIDTGRPLFEHMKDCGGKPEALRNGQRFLDPSDLRAFLEIHIEQAPSLVEAGVPVGICTGIPGNFRYPNVRIDGEHAHVGLPRRFRRDAAIAAAELAMAVDKIWEEHETAGRPMACTFGRFHTNPDTHSMTIVPGEFHYSLDIRAYDENQLMDIERRLFDVVADIEQRRRVGFDLGRRANAPVGTMNGEIRASFERGARALQIDAMLLPSPASHDAAAFAAAGVPTAMLFVRNENGSHNPLEAMDMGDFLQATSVLTWWLAENVCD